MRKLFAGFSQKVINSTLILSLREAFISLLPYVIAASVFSLIMALLNSFHILDRSGVVYEAISYVASLIHAVLPMAIVVAISYYLSKNIGVNAIECSVLALTSFVVSSGYLLFERGSVVINMDTASGMAILIPVVSVYMMKHLAPIKIINAYERRFVSAFLVKHVNLILPFLAVFVFLHLLLPQISVAAKGLVDVFFSGNQEGNPGALMLKWNLLVHAFWFLGIHGSLAATPIMGRDFFETEIFSGLQVSDFQAVFINLGGSGAIWGFLIAVLIVARDEHLKKIAKLSVPFCTFNVSEILMYGVPIVLNPFFIVPFLLCPLLNVVVAYIAIDFGWISIMNTQSAWMTPVFISGYIMGQGSFSPAILQFFLIVMNAFIYFPFVRMYSTANSELVMAEQLASGLSIEEKSIVSNEQASVSGRRYELSRFYKGLRRTIDEITSGELIVYYQPKFNTEEKCVGLEALLRLKKSSGDVVGPYFLSQLDKAGFSDAVDWWVVDKIAEDLQRWKQNGFEPNVSINLNPYVILEKNAVERLIKNFEKYNGRVEIEIAETAYIKNFKLIKDNVLLLKKNGIETAIDDFGTGFSSLSLLCEFEAKTIKLDKAVLDNIETKKGSAFYSELCALCKQLGFEVVAEGVEEIGQKEFVTAAGVDYMQGQLFSAPLPAFEMEKFVLKAK